MASLLKKTKKAAKKPSTQHFLSQPLIKVLHLLHLLLARASTADHSLLTQEVQDAAQDAQQQQAEDDGHDDHAAPFHCTQMQAEEKRRRQRGQDLSALHQPLCSELSFSQTTLPFFCKMPPSDVWKPNILITKCVKHTGVHLFHQIL